VSELDREALLAAGIEALKALAQGGGKECGRSEIVLKIVDMIGRPLMASIGAERCLCVTVDEAGRPVEVIGRTVEGRGVPRAERYVSHFLVRQVVQSGQTVVVRDARRDRRWRSVADWEQALPTRSLAGIPLWRNERVCGVLCLLHPTSPLDLRGGEKLFELLAQIVACAIGPGRPADKEKKRLSSAGEVRPGAAAQPEPFTWRGITTRSPRFRSVLETAARIASKSIPVVLVGEDGTGREAVARAIHAASGRSGPFVVAAVRAIPPTLIEAELFGHVAGAFTGAATARRGLVAEAHRGTLYLDDLVDMPEAMQAALLRVLTEGVVRPLGSNECVEVDVRIIAASTVTVEQLVAEGVLREDLGYRLQGLTLEVPPLRERAEDILPLFKDFLKESNPDAVPRLAEDAERAVLLHSWPGNVRELRNEALRLGALDLREVRARDLSFTPKEAEEVSSERFTVKPLPDAVAAAERDQIERALALSGGNKAKAARILGITRRTLYRRLERYGLK